MALYKPNFDKDLIVYYDQIKEMFQTQRPKLQAINLAKFVFD